MYNIQKWYLKHHLYQAHLTSRLSQQLPKYKYDAGPLSKGNLDAPFLFYWCTPVNPSFPIFPSSKHK